LDRAVDILLDILAIIGVAFIARGLWWVFPPVSLIFVGAVLVFVSLRLARPEGRRER